MSSPPPGFVIDSPNQGNVFTLPQNPKDAAAQEAERIRLQIAQQQAALQQQAAQRAAAEWAASHNPDGTPKQIRTFKPMPDAVAKRYEDAVNAYANLDRAIGGFKNDYAGNTITGGAENSIQSRFSGFGTPGQSDWWADIATTDNALRNALFGASLTAGEQAAWERTTVTPSMDPEKVLSNLERRREIARDILSRKTNFLKANGYDPEAVSALLGEVSLSAPANGAGGKDDRRDPMALAAPTNSAPPMAPDPWNENSNDPTRPSSGLFLAPATRQQQSDPAAAALANKVFAQTGSIDAVNTALEQAGYSERFGQPSKALLDYNKKVPGYGYFRPGLITVQNSIMERISGGAPAAAVAGFTNTATGGTVKALTGDKYNDMAVAHPYANATGEIGGAIAGTSALGKGVGAVAGRYAPSLLQGGKWANRARAVGTDAAYGGIYGGMTENDPVSGALYGTAGSIAGRGAGKVGGRLIQGFKPTQEAQYLASQGVPLTFGQTVGGMAKGFEDRMTSIPGVGDMVNARRMEGFRGYNQAEFNNAGAGIGFTPTDIGKDGLRQLDQAKGNAYSSALDGAQIDTLNDPQLVQDVAAAQTAASQIPNVQPTMPSDFAMRSLENRVTGAIDPNGMLSGRAFQEGYRGLARDARTRVNSDFGHEIGQATRLGQDALAGALERQNPGAFTGFQAANNANRRIGVLGEAVNAARNGSSTGELNVFSPAQYINAAAANARKFPGGLDTRLAQAAQTVMPNKVPDSGTPGRLLQAMGGGLIGGSTLGGGTGYALGGGDGAQTGGALGGGGTIGLLGLLALGGTKGGQKALKAALTDSGSLTRAGAASLVRKGGGLFGKASIPLLLQ